MRTHANFQSHVRVTVMMKTRKMMIKTARMTTTMMMMVIGDWWYDHDDDDDDDDDDDGDGDDDGDDNNEDSERHPRRCILLPRTNPWSQRCHSMSSQSISSTGRTSYRSGVKSGGWKLAEGRRKTQMKHQKIWRQTLGELRMLFSDSPSRLSKVVSFRGSRDRVLRAISSASSTCDDSCGCNSPTRYII